MRKSEGETTNDAVVLEVLPGQAWVHEYWNQPIWSTLPRGLVLVGPSPYSGSSVLPFAGMGDAEGETMQEQHLKRVHLSRLSPVMWSWGYGYPRKELGVPIRSAYGMGSTEGDNYELATPINPLGMPVWSETWQQRAAGALKRRSLMSMAGCNCGVGNNDEPQPRPWLGLGLFLAFGVGLLYFWNRSGQ